MENGNQLEQVSYAREYFRYDYFQQGKAREREGRGRSRSLVNLVAQAFLI